MTEAKHTPGPWEYVPSTEHHGPYVTSSFGSTICDCYVMSHPGEPSTAAGGKSKPISFLHEMADPNSRLIAAAPDMLSMLQKILSGIERGKLEDQTLLMRDGEEIVAHVLSDRLREIIAKATGVDYAQN